MTHDEICAKIDAYVAAPEMYDEDEEPPSLATIGTLKRLIRSVEIPSALDCEIGTFYGELSARWKSGEKRLVLVTFPKIDPVLVCYMPGVFACEAVRPVTDSALRAKMAWLVGHETPRPVSASGPPRDSQAPGGR